MQVSCLVLNCLKLCRTAVSKILAINIEIKSYYTTNLLENYLLLVSYTMAFSYVIITQLILDKPPNIFLSQNNLNFIHAILDLMTALQHGRVLHQLFRCDLPSLIFCCNYMQGFQLLMVEFNILIASILQIWIF